MRQVLKEMLRLRPLVLVLVVMVVALVVRVLLLLVLLLVLLLLVVLLVSAIPVPVKILTVIRVLLVVPMLGMSHMLLLLALPLAVEVRVRNLPALEILVLAIAVVDHGLLVVLGLLGLAVVVLGIRVVLQSAMSHVVGKAVVELVYVPVDGVRPMVKRPLLRRKALHVLFRVLPPSSSFLWIRVLNEGDHTLVAGGTGIAAVVALVLLSSRVPVTVSRLRRVGGKGGRLRSMANLAVSLGSSDGVSSAFT